MSRTRLALFGGTLAFYLAIVVAVLASSWLVIIDWKVMLFRPYQQWPEVHATLDYFVVLGQRGPTAVMVAAWLGWRSWRQHTLRPLLVLGAALLLLNVTVGAVKLGLGRLGPHYATQVGSTEMFAGGDIFPSGHTANAVVTWGILAYLATTPTARRVLSAVSAVVALGVGLTTVYLGTHWLSDVLLGWAAGLLILLALPWCEPLMGRAEAVVFAARERLRARRRRLPTVPVAAGGAWPAAHRGRLGAPAPESAAEEAALDPVGASGGTRTATRATLTHHPRAHSAHSAVRSERTPVTPAGSRRPPRSRPATGG